MLLGVLFVACDAQPQERVLSWVSFDPHVHSSLGSNDTDGTGTPELLSIMMQQRELDYVFLTDHSNSLGSMHCEDVEDCPNLGPEKTQGEWGTNVFFGAEISPRQEENNLSKGTGHIGCLPLNDDFSEVIFIDRPFGEITGKDSIDQCHQANGFAILHHPFGPASWVSFDWTSMDFDAIEIYNGGAGFDPSDEQTLAFWEEQVQAGNILPPLGSSDSHRWSTEAPGTVLDGALGWAQSKIGLEDGASFSAAELQHGRIFLGDPSSHLFYEIRNDNQHLFPGEEADFGTKITLDIAFSSSDSGLQLEVRHITSSSIETIFTQTASSTPQKIELPLTETGHYYARLMPKEITLGVRGFAMGNVISLR